MALQISQQFPIFSDSDGTPLNDGFIYIGTQNLNPETTPVACYWDSALTLPAPQPFRTIGGYIVRNGAPSNVYIAASNYSITIRNKNSALVYSVPVSISNISTKIDSLIDLLNANVNSISQALVTSYYQNWAVSTAMPFGGGQFAWDSAMPKSSHNGGTIISNTVPWDGTVGTHNAFLAGSGETLPAGTGCWVRVDTGYITPQMFGVIASGSVDDTLGCQSAINATKTGGVLAWLPGDYKVTGLTVNKPQTWIGSGHGSLTSGVTVNAYAGGTRISPFGAVTGYLVTQTLGTVRNNEGQMYGFNMSRIYFEGGARATSVGAISLELLDHSVIEDLKIEGFQRSGIKLNKAVRESQFSRIKFKFCGNNTVAGYDPVNNYPTLAIADTGTNTTDGCNQLVFNECNFVYTLGDSVVIDSLSGCSGGVRALTFNDCMFHGLLVGAVPQIPGGGTITTRQTQFSHIINGGDRVAIAGGNITFQGSDTPGVICKASTDATFTQPKFDISDVWIVGRYDNVTTTGNSYAILVSAGFVKLGKLYLDSNFSGSISTASGSTLIVNWNNIDFGTLGSKTPNILGIIYGAVANWTTEPNDKHGISFHTGGFGSTGTIPGSNYSVSIRAKCDLGITQYGGEIGFPSAATEKLSYPSYRSSINGVWGGWKPLLVGAPNGVYKIVSTDYEQVSGAAVTALTITKSQTYIAGAATASMALTLPVASADIDGVMLTIVSHSTRVSTTWISTGATFIGAPATLTADVPVKLQYIHSNAQWWITA